MAGFVVSEALRNLRRAGRLAVSAMLLIALALAALGAFWIVTGNLGEAVSKWRDRVRIVVYLRQEPAGDARQKLLDRVAALPGVASVTFVSRDEALEGLRDALGKDAEVIDQLKTNPLSASLEITPAADAGTPEGARQLLGALAALPEVEEIAGTADWVDRLAEWQRLFTMIGLGVGGLLGLAAVLTVTTATTLVLHARRQETEIMRLVGAPELAIRLPLLLQGMLQGLAGAVLALGVLVVAHRLAAPHLDPLVNLTLGLASFAFLTPIAVMALIATGAALGAAGGWLAPTGR